MTQLDAESEFQWFQGPDGKALQELASRSCQFLNIDATQEDAEGLGRLRQALLPPHGPLDSLLAEHQLQLLQLHSAGPLALDGLLQLSTCRPRVFVTAAASVGTRGFPFALVACRAAQSLVRALRLVDAPGLDADGLSTLSASRQAVKEFARRCTRQGVWNCFGILFGEFFSQCA